MKIRDILIGGLIVAGSVGLGVAPASAGLLGSNVTSQYYAYGGPYDGAGSPASFVADGTVQQTFCATGCIEGFALTVSNDQITYEQLDDNGYWSPSGVSYSSGGITISNGNLLTFLGATITGVTLDAATDMPGFTAANFGFNSGAVGVDWAGLTGISAGDVVVLDVTTSSVPEPATWAMMLVGFGGLGAAMRVARRKQATVAA